MQELLKIFNEHESKCLAKLEKMESHVEKESTVDFSKEPTALQEIRTDKRKLEFQDERPSKIRKTKFPFYEPMDYEFATLAGLIFYFLDYFALIHDAFPNFQIKTYKCDNFCFTCEFCKTQHIIYEKESNSACELLSEVDKYFMHLKKSLGKISAKLYNDHVSSQSNVYSRVIDKLDSLSSIVVLPLCSINYWLDNIPFSCYPSYSVVFYRTLLTRLLYANDVFSPFANYAEVIGNLHSMVVQDKIDELKNVQFSNIPTISN